MKKLLITLTFLFTVFSLNATNYYISSSGVTGNTGLTVGSPKGTLSQVFDAFNLTSGDTINVAAGTYNESGTTVGSNDEGFTILGATMVSGAPTSIFSGTSSSRFLYFNDLNNDNITLSKLEIKNYYKSSSDGGGIYLLSGCNTISFINCIFDNCDSGSKGGAIYLDGNIVSFSKCTFKNCDASSEGGAISSNTSACTIVISKCKFYSNSGSYGSAVEVEGTSSSITITNSLFYKNNATTIGTIGVDCGTNLSMSNCTIAYNTSSQSATIVTWQLSGSTTSTIKNTISYGNTREDFYKNGGTMNLTNCRYITLFSAMTSNVSGTTTTPSFTNTTTDDYTLLGSSNCIDGGVNVASGGMVDDLNSFTRVGLPDIGCYESNTVALPIELLYFNGKSHIYYNRLEWSTASEYNNDFFTIEKSIDGTYFYNIYYTKGAGNSNYTLYYNYNDNSIDKVINYYILRQTDYDGRWKESDIISVDNRAESAPLLLKVTNLLGQEVNDDETGVLLYHYSDGTILKRIH